MKEAMKRLSACVMLAIMTVTCGGEGPTTSTPLPTPTRPTATLSGLVFAVTPTGLRPVEGARVRLEVGSFRLDALTDQHGLYSMTGLYEGSSSVTTSREGYDIDTRKVTISGDVRLDIGVVPRVPHTVSGVVFEMTPSGRVPVEGARVHWSETHVDYLTDATGFYSVSGVFNGFHTLVVGKEGYQEAVKQMTSNGDTLFDIQLVRR